MERLKKLEEELRKCGWHIRLESLPELLGDELSLSSMTDSLARDTLVAQLLDSDLKDVGRPCLPETLALQRSPRLQGPLVLQVASVRNICQTSSKSLLRTSYEHVTGRLLRIYLTDGYNVISVIEYHPMNVFSVDVAPGTKVILENTISMHSGFLLGDALSFKILGGHVPALYESWEMERKYSGLVRLTTVKAARAEDDSGPPPFRGLHVSHQRNQSAAKKPPATLQGSSAGPAQRISAQLDSSSNSIIPSANKIVHQHINCKTDINMDEQSHTSASIANKPEFRTDADEASTAFGKDSDVRRDAIKAALALRTETAPSHNRVAAQKLLEKRADGSPKRERGSSRSRSRGRGRGRGGRASDQRGARQLEETTLTLDEWEAKKEASSSRVTKTYGNTASSYDDETLARKLHYELNVDSGVTTGDAFNEAEQIRLSMFSFAGVNNDDGQDQRGGRGRGKGRGRGRRRGR